MPTTLRKTSRSVRSNEQRSHQTQQRIIDAALELLFMGGYSSATTTRVAKQAGVSRGAMTHHFSSRADLMLAVAEHVVVDQYRRRFRELLKGYAGKERFHAGAETSWANHCHPTGIALLEIMMACRSDRRLLRRFSPFIARSDKVRKDLAILAAKDLGIADIGAVDDMLQVHQAALRGLSIQLMLTNNVEEIERARRLFTNYERGLVDQLMRQSSTE
jgi:AcrR family transcriptional regulator